jgi:hypothetical protein
MNEQLLYTLLAASIGFVAAVCFCFGSASMKNQAVIDLATSYWGYHREWAKAIVSQSTQYLIGALLLIASFVLQVVAVLASPANLILFPSILSNPFVFVGVSLILFGSISFGLYGLLLRTRLPKILQALERNAKQS